MHSMAKTLLRIGAIAAGFALLSSSPAAAQPGLGPLDHYKVYRFNQPIPVSAEVVLSDQFIAGPYQLAGPRWFSPPAQKNLEPVHNGRIHFTWYDIFSPIPDPNRRVLVHNQFGSSELEVRQSRYLLAPTLKNEPIQPPPFPPLPVDHYKCYDAFGAFVVRTVTLVTQFGTEVVQVAEPQLLCNPVQKMHLGIVTPIVNPTDHLVCYVIGPQQTLNLSIQRQDQFGASQGVVLENRWLCVPSLKEIPTGTEATTWSRVRALYR